MSSSAASNEARPKITPLKLKGQKPKFAEVRKRPHSELETTNQEQKSTSPNHKPEATEGQPAKKLHTLIQSKMGKSLNVTITEQKTQAELAFELVRRKRMLDRVDKKLDKSHKEKMLEYNKMLNRIPDHCDIPKIGEKVQKGY